MWKVIARPRVLLYGAVWAAIGIGMLVVLAGRSAMDISVAQERNPVYVVLSDGDVRNSYTVKLMNKQHAPREFDLTVSGLEGARLSLPVSGEAPAKRIRLNVRPDGVDTWRVQVRVPAASLKAEQSELTFKARAADGDGDTMETTRFTAPATSLGGAQ
jgi:polyferredoxin